MFYCQQPSLSEIFMYSSLEDETKRQQWNKRRRKKENKSKKWGIYLYGQCQYYWETDNIDKTKRWIETKWSWNDDWQTHTSPFLSNRGDLPAKYGSRAHFHIRLFIFAEDTSNIWHGGGPIRRTEGSPSQVKASQDALHPSSFSKVSSHKGGSTEACSSWLFRSE